MYVCSLELKGRDEFYRSKSFVISSFQERLMRMRFFIVGYIFYILGELESEHNQEAVINVNRIE